MGQPYLLPGTLALVRPTCPLATIKSCECCELQAGGCSLSGHLPGESAVSGTAPSPACSRGCEKSS